MATPIGHSLAGYLFYHFSGGKKRTADWRKLIFFTFFANLADFDYFFGLFSGQPNLYHHQFTHSFAFAVIIAGVFAGVMKVDPRKKFWASFLMLLAIYLSHILIDFFTLDTTAPFGEQLFWPFSQNYYISEIWIFRDIHKGDTTGELFRNLFSTYNWITGLTEIFIFFTFALIIKIAKRLMQGKMDEARKN